MLSARTLPSVEAICKNRDRPGIISPATKSILTESVGPQVGLRVGNRDQCEGIKRGALSNADRSIDDGVWLQSAFQFHYQVAGGCAAIAGCRIDFSGQRFRRRRPTGQDLW